MRTSQDAKFGGKSVTQQQRRYGVLNWAPFWISNRKGASEANFFIIGLTELIYISNYWKFQGEHIFVNLLSKKLKVFACIAKKYF